MIENKPIYNVENDGGLQGADSASLFPVLLKLDNVKLLLVGGGRRALLNLKILLQHAPGLAVSIVAKNILGEIKEIARTNSNIFLQERYFEAEDLDEKNFVLIAVNDVDVTGIICLLAKDKGVLVNVAGEPSLSDIYFNEERNDRLQHSSANTTSRFDESILKATDLATVLVSKQSRLPNIDLPEQKKWPRIVIWCLLAFLLMIIGHAILSYVPFHALGNYFRSLPSRIDATAFLIMLITGFIAQMADGSLGMGYGTIATTFLLAQGVNPAIVSSRVHAARVFSSGVSGYSHHRFGNINKKLFRTLAIPGITGAAIGAALAYFGQQYSDWIKLPLSLYTIYLGIFIIRKAFRKRLAKDKVKRAGWLAAAGGFMDAFAGGGWGTLVTSTLLSKRKSPRYVIGSVCLAEFFVVLASSLTFFILLLTAF